MMRSCAKDRGQRPHILKRLTGLPGCSRANDSGSRLKVTWKVADNGNYKSASRFKDAQEVACYCSVRAAPVCEKHMPFAYMVCVHESLTKHFSKVISYTVEFPSLNAHHRSIAFWLRCSCIVREAFFFIFFFADKIRTMLMIVDDSLLHIYMYI